jgi:hypothetical protein
MAMYVKDKNKPKDIEQLIDTEANFITQAKKVKLIWGNEEKEEVFMGKFAGLPIDFKISVHFPGAKVVSEKSLTKDEIRTLLSSSMQGNIAFY